MLCQIQSKINAQNITSHKQQQHNIAAQTAHAF